MSLNFLPDEAPDRSWVAQGNCHKNQGMSIIERKERLDIFFMKSRSSKEAVKICQGCPVLDRCYDYAVTAGIQYGVWGGVAFNRDGKKEEDEATEAVG